MRIVPEIRVGAKVSKNITNGIICVVVYVDRREKIRIVAARPAVSKGLI